MREYGLFRSFEILVILRKSPSLRECFDNNAFDKLEVIECLDSEEVQKVLDLSRSVYDSDEEQEVIANPDVTKLVEEAFRSFDRRFKHFQALGMPPLQDNEEEESSQIITIVENDGSLRSVKIPKNVELNEAVDIPPILRNFYLVNLREIKKSLGNLALKPVEIQDTLVARILKEMGGSDSSSESRGRSPEPKRQRKSPPRNFEKAKKLSLIHI